MKKHILSIIFVFATLLPVIAQTYTTIPYNQGFESSTSFGDYPEITEGGTNEYRNEISTSNSPRTGSNHLVLDDHSNNSSLSKNYVYFHFDLSGQTQVQFDFFLKDFEGENHAGDEILFSDDGGSSYTSVMALTSSLIADNTFDLYSLDVDALAAANGLSLTSTFIIQISHEDDRPATSDGYAIDDISVYVPTEISTSTNTTCSGTLIDDGADAGGFYNNTQDFTQTISPTNATSVQLDFNWFKVESQASCNFDYLEVYDGATTGDPLIGKYCTGTEPPASIISTNGSITLKWFSDGSEVRSGFVIDWQGLFDASTTTKTDITCNAANDGSIDASFTGGTTAFSYSWSSGATTEDLTGLSAGAYSLTATDVNGCLSTTVTTVTEPAVLTFTYDITAPTPCTAGTGGEVSLTVTGGPNPAYTYAWDDPGNQTTSTATGLTNGTYNVTISSNSCTITEAFDLSSISASASVTNVDCNGNTTGEIDLTVSGGLAPYVYTWSDVGISTQDRTSLAAAVYTCTITDVNTCNTTIDVTVTEPAVLGVTAAVSSNYNGEDISCKSGADGTALATPTGGTTNYTYLWSNAQTTATATGLADGTHGVTITDANGCTANNNVALAEPASAVSVTNAITSNFNGEDISCIGSTDGTASSTPAGGTGAFTYLWSTGAQTTQNATGLGIGSHIVTVQDANNCPASSTVTIVNPTAITLTNNVTSNYNGAHISCNGDADGQATATPTGGTGAFTYLWSAGAQVTAIATGLNAGTHTVTVTDANSCTSSQPVTVTAPNIITVSPAVTSNFNGAHISCVGSTNGQATSSPTGGTGAFTYLWSASAQATATATGLGAGIHSVTVTDANSCTNNESITITSPSAITVLAAVTSNYNGEDISCNTANDGTANATPSGGTGVFTYLWSASAQNTAAATGLNAGTHNVTVSDANSCTQSTTVTLTEPSAITLTSAVTSNYNGANISCVGSTNGTASSTPSGGTGAFTYLWSTGAQTTQNATGLSAGNITVTATDVNGCSETSVVTITTPAAITVTTTVTSDYNGEDVSCVGSTDGTASANPTGGTGAFTYLWNVSAQATQNVTGLADGTHTVTVSDANSCVETANVVVNDPADVSVTVAVTSNYNGEDVSCNGDNDGAATATPSGGVGTFTYLWDASAGAQTTAIATGLSAATYTVTISDNNGCSTSESVTLTEPTTVSVSAAVASNHNGEDVSCVGSTDGSATATPTGGTAPFTYLWDNGQTNQTATGLNANTYSVTTTDANGCTESTTVSLSNPSAVSVTVAVTSNFNGEDISCNGGNNGQATATPAGGVGAFTYLWSIGAQATATATGLSATNYSVTVTDGNGCPISEGITLTEPSNITVTSAITSNFNGEDVTCVGANDGTASSTPSGGTGAFTYLWSTGAQTTQNATGLNAGTHSVTVADANSCTESSSVTISNPSAITLTTAVTTNYNGEDVSCNGSTNGQATASPTGGTGAFTYLWNVGGQTTPTATGLSATNYAVTVSDANGCASNEGITLTEPTILASNPSVSSNHNGEDVSCNGATDGSVTSTPSGGTAPYTYLWNAAAGNATTSTVTGLSAGTGYRVTVTDVNGCTHAEGVTISEPTSIAVSISVTSNFNGEDISCFGENDGQATVTPSGGTGAYNYLWSIGAQATATATGLSATTYSVTVDDANNCPISTTITLTQPSALSLSTAITSNYNGEDVSCNGDNDGTASSTPAGGTGAYTYLWSTAAQTTQNATGLASGTQTVTVSDVNSCEISSSVTLTDPTLLTVSTSVTSDYNGQDVTCNGATDGSAIANGTGGTGAYGYNWNTGTQTTQTASGLGQGTHNVTINDVNGCTANTNVALTQPTTVVASAAITSNYNGEDLSCNGSSNGTASVTPSNGTAGYTYLWQNGQTTNTASGINAGLFSVSVYDANNCLATDNVTLQNPDGITVTTAVTSNYNGGVETTCWYSSDGEVTATANGGTGALAYSWNDAGSQNTAVATGLTVNNYTVTITDDNGCTSTSTVTITGAPAIVANNGKNDVSINGGQDGEAWTAPTGGVQAAGTEPYDYLWAVNSPYITNGEKNDSLQTGLQADNYFVTITDDNGCDLDVTITVNEAAVLDGGTLTHANANGGIVKVCSNDTIITNIMELTPATGGDGNYTFVWEFSTDFVNWNPLVPASSDSSYRYDVTITNTTFIRRNLTDGVGANTTSSSLVFLATDTTTTSTDLETEYCINEQPVLINGFPTNNGGSFNINPAGGLVDHGDGTATLTPWQTSAASVVVTYTYVDGNGCTSVLEEPVAMHTITDADYVLKPIYELSGDPDTLAYTVYDTIAGLGTGVFSGPGITPANGVFTPSSAGIGTHNIVYTYTDQNSCIDTTDYSTVVANATGDILGIDNNGYYCIDGIIDTLYGDVGTQGVVGSGRFRMTNIETGNFVFYESEATFPGGDTTRFNPALSINGGGTFLLEFQYTSNLDGTSTFSVSDTIRIVDVINIDFASSYNDSLKYCVDAPEDTLYTYFTYGTNNTFTGASFFGNGIDAGNIGYFNPETAGYITSPHSISVSYTDAASGCSNNISKDIIVKPLPIIDFTMKDLYNITEGKDTISATPYGGSFTSTANNFVLDSIFDLSLAGLGNNPISVTYQYINSDGCVNDSVRAVNIQQSAGSIDLFNPSNGDYYCYDGIIDTIKSTIANIPTVGGEPNSDGLIGSGTFYIDGNSLAGVNNGAFAGDSALINPFNIGTGSHTIDFVYLGYDGITEFTISTTLNIGDDTYAFIFDTDDNNDYCVDIIQDDISGGIDGIQTPNTDGEFTNTAYLTDLGNGTARFTPTGLTVNTPYPVTYTYTDPVSLCSTDTTIDLFVRPLPTPDFVTDSIYNVVASSDTLYGIPAGGFFSGSGIANITGDTALFNPFVPGTGTTNISYAYTDTNNCSATEIKPVYVQEAGGNISLLNSSTSNYYCIDGGIDTLIGTAGNLPDFGTTYSDGIPATGYFTGNGIVSLGGDSALFDPQVAGIGSHVIQFTYLASDSITAFTIDTTIVVSNIGYAHIFNLDDVLPSEFDYCISAPIDTIAGNINGNTSITANGSFLNSSFLTDLGDGTAKLEPQQIGAGNSGFVTYEYTDPTSQCLVDTTIEIFVRELPVLAITTDSLYNKLQTNDTIFGLPTGGQFSSFTGIIEGFNNDTAVFSANNAIAPSGRVFVDYTYTDVNGCTNTTQDTLRIQNANGSIILMNPSSGTSYCIDGSIDTIIGIPGNTPTLLGSGIVGSGNFHIDSVNSPLNSAITNITGSDSAIFDPSLLTSGAHTLYFTFKGYDNDVDFTISQTINIDSIGYAHIFNLDDVAPSVFDYCIDAGIDFISGNINGNTSLTTNGIFTNDAFITDLGDGTARLDPVVIGAGNSDFITYEYTSPTTQCKVDTTIEIFVRELPVPTVVLDPLYNKLQTVDTIYGLPVGGEFDAFSGLLSGDGNDTAIFNANNAIAASGELKVTYNYTDTNGCVNFVNDTIRIQSAGGSIELFNTSFANNYCIDGDIDTIVGIPGNTPTLLGQGIIGSGSFYVDSVNSPLNVAITDFVNSDTATLNPGLLTSGAHTLYFTFKGYDNDVDFLISQTINIDSIGYARIFNLDDPNDEVEANELTYCVDAGTDVISGAINGEASANANGVFSNAAYINDLGDGTAEFYPATLGDGNSDFVTYTYTNPATLCIVDTTIELTVQPLPVLSVVGFDIDDQYCSNEDAVAIYGLPRTGDFTSLNVTDIGSLTDSVIFNPQGFATVGNKVVTYAYTDTLTGCANVYNHNITLDTIPIVGITSFNPDYCIDIDTTTVQGTLNFQPFNQGTFTGSGISNSTGDGTAFYHPSLIGVQRENINDTIRFTYTDQKGCTNFIDAYTVINTLPEPYITQLDTQYCEINLEDIQTFFGNDTIAAQASVHLWTLDGGLLSNAQSADLDIATLDAGMHAFKYELTDINGCKSNVIDSVEVSPMPVAAFTIFDECIADSIRFLDTSFVDLVFNDQIVEWDWITFDDDVNDNSTMQNPSHLYTEVGARSIELRVKTNKGCWSEITESEIILGDNPNAGFFWDNECVAQDSIRFYDTSPPSNPGAINHYEWNFGDGSASVVDTDDSYKAHSYSLPGDYDVSLILLTDAACTDTIIKTIHVRDSIVPTPTNPYFVDFENGFEGWYAESADSINSWTLGTPNKTLIDTAYSGTNSWVTGIDSSYQNNENSYVVGPCFDFTKVNRPMIIFKKFGVTQLNDGAVLQYYVDTVTGEDWRTARWTNIGTLNSGINWYNANAIEGNPGNQLVGNEGWSNTNDTTWVEVRHKLDSLVGLQNVRLRIAFGANNTITNEGFAFDDIWIGDRTKNVLVESFTSNAINAVVDDNQHIQNLYETNNLDVLNINYHTAFDGTDQMHLDNTVDVNTRNLVYGITSTQKSIMDGNQFNGTSTDLTQGHITKRTLQDPGFEIEMNSEKAGNTITVDARIISNLDIPKAEITLHLAMVEKQITSLVGANGETEFNYVFKKMLPDAAGTNYAQPWSVGSTKATSESWTMDNYYDINQFMLVGFVQNDVTKEVYQAVYNDTALTTSVIAIEELKEELLNTGFVVYPNPSKGKFNLEFLNNNTKVVEFYNQFGQVIKQVVVTNTVQQIDLSNFTNGVYYVSVKENGSLIKTEKLIISH